MMMAVFHIYSLTKNYQTASETDVLIIPEVQYYNRPDVRQQIVGVIILTSSISADCSAVDTNMQRKHTNTQQVEYSKEHNINVSIVVAFFSRVAS